MFVLAACALEWRSASAFELTWSGGASDLPNSDSAGTCTLYVRATLPGETLDPAAVRLVWAGIGATGRGLVVRDEAVPGSTFEVCGPADSDRALDFLTRTRTVSICDGLASSVLLAWVLEREAGFRARIRLWVPGRGGADATIGGGGGLLPPPALARAEPWDREGEPGVRIAGDFADAAATGEILDSTGVVLVRGAVERTGATTGWFAAVVPKEPGGLLVRVMHPGGSFDLTPLLPGPAPRMAPSATNTLVVRLRPGELITAPPTGDAPPEEFSFATPGLASTLAAHGVAHLAPLFPDFTSVYSTNLIGEPIVLEDLSTIYLATLGETTSDSTAFEGLLGTPGLHYVHLNRSGNAEAAIPNDPMFPLQWGLRNSGDPVCGEPAMAGLDLDLVDAWDITFGAQAETIAVLESGLDVSHEEFASGNYVLESGVSTTNLQHHGTHVIGVLAGDTNNGVGIAGIAPGCVPHVRSVGDGSSPASLSEAIAWSTARRRTIVNISHGVTLNYFYPPYSPPFPQLNAMNDVCLNGFHSGQFLVASSGNDDDGLPRYPAAFDHRVIAVGGIGPQTDTLRWADKYHFDPVSQFGSTFGPWMDFCAPANVLVAPERGPAGYFDFQVCDYQTGTWTSGTSYAAPAVAGVAGLLRSVEPRLLGEDLLQILARTSRDIPPAGPDDSSGYGLPQARGALDYLAHGTKAFVQGTIGAYGSHGNLIVADSARVLRSFVNFPQLACTTCVESTTVYRLVGEAQFAAGFSSAPDMWPRSSGTLGFTDNQILDYRSVVHEGRALPGSITATACSLETHVYRIDGFGWLPAQPESARIAFSSLGPSSLVAVNPVPGTSLQLRPYPNPSRGILRFDLRGHPGGHARVEVFDVRGRRVRLIEDGSFSPGDHHRTWDARDERGRRVAPGAYLVRYSSAGQSRDAKFVLLGRQEQPR